jgi:hypothetical protein
LQDEQEKIERIAAAPFFTSFLFLLLQIRYYEAASRFKAPIPTTAIVTLLSMPPIELLLTSLI